MIPLRPLGLGELLDGAVQVVRRYPRPTLGLSAVISLVSTVLTTLLVLTAFRPFASIDGGGSTTTGRTGTTTEIDAEIGAAIGGTGLTFVVTFFATTVLAGVITAVVGRAVLGQPISFSEAWASVRPRVLPLIGLSLLVFLMVGAVFGAGIAAFAALTLGLGAGGALLGVPLLLAGGAAAAYLYTRFSLAPPALVLERSGVREALRRSGVLVHRSWWRVFGILLLTWLIVQIVGGVLQLPFAVLGAGGELLSGDVGSTGTGYLIASAIGAGLSQALVAPFDSGVRALLYVDRRMRAEGLDVSLQASAAVPAAAASPDAPVQGPA